MVSVFIALTVLNCSTMQEISASPQGKEQVREFYTCERNSKQTYVRKSSIESMNEATDNVGNSFCILTLNDKSKVSAFEDCKKIAKQVRK